MRSRLGTTAPLVIGLLAWASVGPRAQAPAMPAVTPFDVIGFIDAATINDPADVFSGGTVTVNGFTYVVPTNTLLQMPAFALTWQELFAHAPAPWGPTQTGLARGDTPPTPTDFEIHLVGNRVISATSDQSIVGLMFAAQEGANLGTGFINFIDYATGEMRVGGTIGDPTTGARIRLNDPIGRHGRVMTHDARFTQDEDNPTVRSQTGYPMCVPRVAPTTVNADGTIGDALCPEKNRPRNPVTGSPLTTFTTDPPPNTPGVDPAFVRNGTDAHLMAPFEVGDYILYNANLVNDASGPYNSAWGITANVGIFTAPGTQPTYVQIDAIVIGTIGIPIKDLPQAVEARTIVEGYSTDPGSFVTISALDVDACTGETTKRFYGTVTVDSGVAVGRAKFGLGAIAGRWRFRPTTDYPFLPATRMLIAESSNGIEFGPDPANPQNVIPIPTPNGIFAGQYQAPNFDFVFTEQLRMGNPLPPNIFQDVPFLAAGSGPYFGAFPTNPPTRLGKPGQTLGQLSPWPTAVAPTPPSCAAGSAVFAPVADAGAHQNVTPATTVTLDATRSTDPNTPARSLTFSWTQTGGPTAPLTAPNTARPTFVAPQLQPDATGAPIPATLQFIVTVSNGFLDSKALVTVTDAARPTPVDTLAVTLATFAIRRSILTVDARSSDPGAVLTLLGFGEFSSAIPPAPGAFEYAQVGVNRAAIGLTPLFPAPLPLGTQPQAIVTVRSSLGGVATLPVTVVP
jgi:hypothetical protein